MPDISDETAILGRLAQAHKEWRARRPNPPTVQRTPEEEKAVIDEVLRRVRNPEPRDVALLGSAADDPVGTVIASLLSVVGWRLYAKGGSDLLNSVYRRLEVEQHPGFVWAVQGAWRDLGFPGDPRGTWHAVKLL